MNTTCGWFAAATAAAAATHRANFVGPIAGMNHATPQTDDTPGDPQRLRIESTCARNHDEKQRAKPKHLTSNYIRDLLNHRSIFWLVSISFNI